MGCTSNTHLKQNFTGLGASTQFFLFCLRLQRGGGRATARGTSHNQLMCIKGLRQADATVSIDTYNEYMLRLYQLVTKGLSRPHFTDANTEVNRLVNLTKVLRQ